MSSDDGGFVQVQLQGVQDWVTSGATELSVLGGGSALLRQTFEEAADEVGGWLVDQGHSRVSGAPGAGGDGPPSSGFWFPVVASSTISGVFADECTARQAGVRLHTALQRRLPGAAIDVKVAAYPTQPQAGRSPYQIARRSLTSLPSPGSADEQAPGPTPVPPDAQLCAACGAERATDLPPRRDRARRAPWCEMCIGRQKASQTRTGLLDLPGIEGLEGAEALELATQFQTIGAGTRSARYRGYMAVIAADGDGIGQRLTAVDSPAALHATSRDIERSVSRAIERGLLAAVAKRRADLQAVSADPGHPRGDDTQTTVPYNPVVIAGDDICVAVPADLGVAVAAALATADPDFPMSAGVLVCHDSLPFSVARDAAEALKKRAKKAARADTARGAAGSRPHVAFAVESAAAVRADLEDDPLRGLPYPAEAVEQLRRAASELTVPPSRAATVIAALRQGGRLAEREWARYLLVEPKAARQQLTQLYTSLGGSQRPGRPTGPRPWLNQPDGQAQPGTSPFEDLVLIRTLEAAA